MQNSQDLHRLFPASSTRAICTGRSKVLNEQIRYDRLAFASREDLNLNKN